MQLPPPRYIDNLQGLEEWAHHLSRANVIGVDTESDSFFRYREKVCLIQMTANGEDAIIDPLAVGDLSALAEIMADPTRIKVFHDAIYDLICLRRDFGFELQGLFDTMLASRLLGRQSFGLAKVLEDYYGHVLDKKYQRSNWASRPLSAEQLAYAQADTHFLPGLRDVLSKELEAEGRLLWALEDFERLPEVAARVAPRSDEPDPEGFWRVKGVKNLSPVARGRAKALYLMREHLAKRMDRPPFKVFGDVALVNLAEDPPMDDVLRPRPGLGAGAVDRFGSQIIAAIKKAKPIKGRPPPGTGRRRRSGRSLDPRIRSRYEALRELRRRVAGDLGIDPEILVGNAVLEDIAKRPPTSRDDLLAGQVELRGWRQSSLVDPLWQAVTEFGDNGAAAEASELEVTEPIGQ